MSKVIVDPVTRIEGHLHIETDVAPDGTVTGAYSSGTMFRGIEEILKGRDPRDAWAITQRICGVCTVVHAMASIRSVEHALHYPIPKNARLIRNILSGVQMVQDQVVHFYQLTSPDWMDVTSALKADPQKTADLQRCLSGWDKNSPDYFRAVKDKLSTFVSSGQLGIFGNAYWGHPGYKLPPELNLMLFTHYLEALDWQRRMVKIHAIFGGRNPHPNFLVGGVPCAISADETGLLLNGNTSSDPNGFEVVRQTLKEMTDFVDKVHLPDMLAMARFYPEWFALGEGLGNFLSFGDYPQDDNPSWGALAPKLAIPSGAILWPKDSMGRRLPLTRFRLGMQSIPLIFRILLKSKNSWRDLGSTTPLPGNRQDCIPSTARLFPYTRDRLERTRLMSRYARAANYYSTRRADRSIRGSRRLVGKAMPWKSDPLRE